MQINAKAFASDLAWARRFTEKKTSIPILATVLLDARPGTIRITGTDLGVTGVVECGATGDDTWSLAVPPELLGKFLKNLKGAVEIRPGAANSLRVISDSVDAEIVGMDGPSTPPPPAIPTAATLSGLATAIPRVIFAIDKKESRFTLNGALLEAGETSCLVATDGYRLSIAPVEYKGDALRALIPKRALLEVAKLGDSIQLGADENHVVVASGAKTIISRKLTRNFPNYERVLPKEHSGHCALRPSEVLDALERIEPFCDARDHAAIWTADGESITIRAQAPDSGTAQGRVQRVGGAGTLEITLNSHYVRDVLKLAGDSMEMRFSDATHGVEFVAPDGWRVLVMPIRP